MYLCTSDDDKISINSSDELDQTMIAEAGVS